MWLFTSFMSCLQQMREHTLQTLSLKPCFGLCSECTQAVTAPSLHGALESWHLKNIYSVCQHPSISLSSCSWCTTEESKSSSNNAPVLCECKGLACGKGKICKMVQISCITGTTELIRALFNEGRIYFAQLFPAGENPSFLLSFGNAGFGTLWKGMFSCPHIYFFKSETTV